MDNTNNNRINPHQEHRKQLKKKYRYNDSLSKYKKKMPINTIQKEKIDLNQNEKELTLRNLNSGLTDLSSKINEKETSSNYLKYKNDYNSRKRYSFSAPKYHILKPSTPKIKYNLRENKNININTPKTLNDSTYNKTTDNLSYYTDIDNKYNDYIRPKHRNFSRPNYRSILSTNDFGTYTNRKSGNLNDRLNLTMHNITNIVESSKNKELITLNNILQRQNKELRQNTREMRYKINELLNNIKLIRIENQRLNSEKKKIINGNK